jgi:hypothetical protein
MYRRLDRSRRATPVVLGILTLLSVALLLAWDFAPTRFPANAHAVLGALPLAMIASTYLVYQGVHRPPWRELVKAILLAAAFAVWAANSNQLWPNSALATLWNDIAIALFVFDVFLVIVGWPATSPDESFAETTLE